MYFWISKINKELYFILECKTVGGNVKDTPCVFPFIYKSIMYQNCTIQDHDRYWCYTMVNENGMGEGNQWGNCGSGCPSKYY